MRGAPARTLRRRKRGIRTVVRMSSITPRSRCVSRSIATPRVGARPSHGATRQQRRKRPAIDRTPAPYQYAFYEAAADAFKRPKARKGRAVELTAAEVFVAASLAKLGATVLTYPVLLVKSRLQAMGKSTDPAMRYSGTLDAARRIFREEGPAAFYRGFGTKVTQTVFAAALMFAAKEEISRAVRERGRRSTKRSLRNSIVRSLATGRMRSSRRGSEDVSASASVT